MKNWMQAAVITAISSVFAGTQLLASEAGDPASSWGSVSCNFVSPASRAECKAEHKRLGLSDSGTINSPASKPPAPSSLRKATPQEAVWIKEGLSEKLKDAESARLRNLIVITTRRNGEDVSTICGEVNAKNSFGAYPGFAAFIGLLLPESKKALILRVDAAGGAVADVCREKMT